MNGKILFSLLMAVNLGITVLNIPPALDGLMVIYDVSYIRISLLVSALFWSHALMQLPGGVITDRLGLLNALFTSLSCVFVGNGLSAIFPALGQELLIAGREALEIGFVDGVDLAGVRNLQVFRYANEGADVGVEHKHVHTVTRGQYEDG